MGQLLEYALRIKKEMNPPSRDAVNDVMSAFCDEVVKEIKYIGKWRD